MDEKVATAWKSRVRASNLPPVPFGDAGFYQRDRAMHPPAYAPIYKTSVTRSPRLALIAERTGEIVYTFDIHLQGEDETVFLDV